MVVVVWLLVVSMTSGLMRISSGVICKAKSTEFNTGVGSNSIDGCGSCGIEFGSVDALGFFFLGMNIPSFAQRPHMVYHTMPTRR